MITAIIIGIASVIGFLMAEVFGAIFLGIFKVLEWILDGVFGTAVDMGYLKPWIAGILILLFCAAILYGMSLFLGWGFAITLFGSFAILFILCD